MKREGFNILWRSLNRAEKNEIRAAWLARIDDFLLSAGQE
jgi:hypothetical protein